jgi:hypothetical protein
MMACVATEDDVRRLALALPAAIEKPSYGTTGFRVRDRRFARIREERDVLVVWCEGIEENELLIASEPTRCSSRRPTTRGAVQVGERTPCHLGSGRMSWFMRVLT